MTNNNIIAWLEEHWNDYFTENDDFNGWNMIEDLKDYIKEEHDTNTET